MDTAFYCLSHMGLVGTLSVWEGVSGAQHFPRASAEPCLPPQAHKSFCWSSEVTVMFALPERGDSKRENPHTFLLPGPARDLALPVAGTPASGTKTTYLLQQQHV